MTYFLDAIARGVASQPTRREGLRYLGKGIGGLILSAFGATIALSKPVCGACQACDTNTNTCGHPCPQGSGSAICTAAGRDGSYVRLTNYLINQGFTVSGTSQPLLFYAGSSLGLSTLSTSFVTSDGSGRQADLVFTLDPAGNVTTIATITRNGVVVLALNVDPNGRITQTIATQSNSPPGQSSRVQGLEPNLSFMKVCGFIVKKLCSMALSRLKCPTIAVEACALAELDPIPAGLLCVVTMTGACAAIKKFGCGAVSKQVCSCPFNTQPCDGKCCGDCEDCLNDKCVPTKRCGSNACCGQSVCCPPGFTCGNDGKCKSQNSTCAGATCGNFIQCVPNTDCYCWTLSTGGGFCGHDFLCSTAADCSGGTCPPGYVCAIDTCCGVPKCTPVSSQCTSGTTKGQTTLRLHGPTAAHQ